MSLLLTFMELDKLYEAVERMDRNSLIVKLKDLGKDYNFDKYSDEQLYRIWERAEKEYAEVTAMDEYRELVKVSQSPTCEECGTLLNDGGTCPVCDDGEEHLHEWVDANGNKASVRSVASSSAAANTANQSSSGIVTIVYDSSKQKLRARADDGIHGAGYVAFPNNLRTSEGQQYEVETLTWNGKNYRVSGNIKPI